MTVRVYNRVYHPPSDDYVYWLSDNYDPTGLEYPGTPPFVETVDPVVVALPDSGQETAGVSVLIKESANEADDAPGDNENAYQDYSQLATDRLIINVDYVSPFPTIRTSSGETLVDIDYFT